MVAATTTSADQSCKFQLRKEVIAQTPYCEQIHQLLDQVHCS